MILWFFTVPYKIHNVALHLSSILILRFFFTLVFFSFCSKYLRHLKLRKQRQNDQYFCFYKINGPSHEKMKGTCAKQTHITDVQADLSLCLAPYAKAWTTWVVPIFLPVPHSSHDEIFVALNICLQICCNSTWPVTNWWTEALPCSIKLTHTSS